MRVIAFTVLLLAWDANAYRLPHRTWKSEEGGESVGNAQSVGDLSVEGATDGADENSGNYWAQHEESDNIESAKASLDEVLGTAIKERDSETMFGKRNQVKKDLVRKLLDKGVELLPLGDDAIAEAVGAVIKKKDGKKVIKYDGEDFSKAEFEGFTKEASKKLVSKLKEMKESMGLSKRDAADAVLRDLKNFRSSKRSKM